jgi:hypothetical protein
MSQEREYLVTHEGANNAFVSETTQVQTPAPSDTTNTEKTYTFEDISKFREQEKSKLYPQIESLKEENAALRRAEQERQSEFDRQRADAEAEAKRKAEAELDVRELINKRDLEWQQRLDHESQEREKAFALLDQERAFSELNQYRNQRIQDESENIMPELLDMVVGNNKQEIEDSIAGLKARTAQILEKVQQSSQAARAQMQGARVTAPSSGPMDTNSDQTQFTADQVSAMSVTEYAKYRNKLLGQAASERGKGLFG